MAVGCFLATASAAEAPVCERVQVQENSGNGPNYPITLCGNRALPINTLVVDGATLPEQSTTHTRVVFWNP
jgi:hypothetical protein